MQTLYQPQARRILSAVLLCLIGVLPICAPIGAQTLAQRNWVGSGVTVEPWWQRAVFYRIDPDKFQDSDGDGKGDLAGITQRLDYLQSLGVDALILDSTSASESDAGPTTSTLLPGEFDDLVRTAVGRHLRVLVELGAPASQGADAQYIEAAREWLNQGAAGLYIPTPKLEQVDGANHIALLLHQLRALTNSFPGQRVLLADAPAKPDKDLLNALSRETQLTASAAISTATPTAASLRAQLTAALGNAAASTQTVPVKTGRHAAAASEANPLLLASRVPAARVPEETDAAAKEGLERALAVMLLVSRSAVLLEYGQELGLDTAGTSEPRMQWTPTNLKPKPKPPAPKPEEPSYETFHAFIPPLPKDLLPPLRMPEVVVTYEPLPVSIDPDSLPGFTAGTFDTALAAPNGATANVGTEQNDPNSLLHLYRQLIQLHHDNATVRSGAETVLDRDTQGALVWERKAPASSRTSANVVAACNLSDKPVVLDDLEALPTHGLRSLLSPQPKGDLLTVAPYAVLVGEAR